jgi:membrane protein YdbS with pleckstrin-like domain
MEAPGARSAEVAVSVADGVDHPLDRRIIALHRQTGLIGAVVRTVFIIGAALGLARIPPFAPLDGMPFGPFGATPLVILAGALIAAAFAHAWMWPPIAYRHASYRVDDGGIEIRSGVLWRVITTVPRSRVQHTDVSQGPFERRHGLATLSIHTAGTELAEVEVDGLEYRRALAVRDHLLPTRHSHDVV